MFLIKNKIKNIILAEIKNILTSVEKLISAFQEGENVKNECIYLLGYMDCINMLILSNKSNFINEEEVKKLEKAYINIYKILKRG